MPAKDKIRMHVEEIFLSAPKSHRTIELKEELIANLQDRYADLVAQGKDEDLAYNIVISGIGDIDELIRGLQDKYVFDPDASDRQRKKSAMLISTAVGMYIIGIIPIVVFAEFYNNGVIGFIITFMIWAFATMLIVYNAMSKPRYKKEQESIVEDFKEWSKAGKQNKALRKSVNSIIWMCATLIFLGGGMLFGKWYILWLVFILAAVVQKIVDLMFSYVEADDGENRA